MNRAEYLKAKYVWASGDIMVEPKKATRAAGHDTTPGGLSGVSAAVALLARKFNPTEPREPHSGKWVGHGGGAIKDVLKLADRIQLGSDEKFVGSDRISPEGGHDVDTLFAVVDTPHGRRVRVGIIPTHDAGKWRAGNKGGTVDLTPKSVGQLRDDLSAANATAKKAAAKVDAQWKAGKTPMEVELTAAVAEGSIPSDWGALRYVTHLTDDDPTSWLTTLEVDSNADGSAFYPPDLRKLIAKLDQLAAEPAGGQRAAGHDTTPGHDELHHYWTRGPGLAKWAESPTPWTTLYHHLLKYMSPERAKRAASAWFHEIKGYWPGDQKGKNPVGPG